MKTFNDLNNGDTIYHIHMSGGKTRVIEALVLGAFTGVNNVNITIEFKLSHRKYIIRIPNEELTTFGSWAADKIALHRVIADYNRYIRRRR